MVDGRGDFSLVIYDIFGNIAPARTLSSTRMGGDREGGAGGWHVDVSSLPPGIYIAIVREKTAVVASAKFVVVR
jgi:hypothetical protein